MVMLVTLLFYWSIQLFLLLVVRPVIRYVDTCEKRRAFKTFECISGVQTVVLGSVDEGKD